jgi:nucleoside-diphosphate-sugar epimerase
MVSARSGTVLVTGGAGYVGSVVVPTLLSRGYRVRVIDSGWFGLDHVPPEAELISGDILDFDASWLDGVGAVIHLAGLSNDPMAAFSPTLNYIVNAAGAGIVGQAARDAGVRRFIFSSTCSVYGVNDETVVTEEHPVSPKYPYAVAKVMAERQLACLADRDFRPIVLRMGTVVGWSPRMRFDLVTNAMIKTALKERRIVVDNPVLWRPLIDVEDAARAYVCALEADISISEIFNIASENYLIGHLAAIVRETLEEFGVSAAIETQHRPGGRSYRVQTEKATQVLGFRPTKSMPSTIREIFSQLVSRSITNLEDPAFYNIRQMQKLMEEGLLQPARSQLRDVRPVSVPA